jgi:hypothetical protein
VEADTQDEALEKVDAEVDANGYTSFMAEFGSFRSATGGWDFEYGRVGEGDTDGGA